MVMVSQKCDKVFIFRIFTFIIIFCEYIFKGLRHLILLVYLITIQQFLKIVNNIRFL